MGILIRRRRLPTTMLVLILGILHTVLSAAAFALYGYFLGNGTYDALSSFQKTSFIGQIVSVWGLFQGATAVQLVQQHFSEGSRNCASGLFFFILWGSEVAYSILVIYVAYARDLELSRETQIALSGKRSKAGKTKVKNEEFEKCKQY